MPLTERQQQILDLIYRNPRIRTSELTKKLGIRHNQVMNAIHKIETEPDGALLCQEDKDSLSVYQFKQEI